MVEVAANLTLIGPDGPLTLLEAFEGRRQLIAYYFMWHPDKPAAEQCEGCTWVTTQATELSYIHSRDITYAVFCQGPYDESIRYHDFMAWDMPWYSAQPSLDALLVGRHIGMMHIVCYLRDGDRVFETYWTTRRGVEAWTTATRSWTSPCTDARSRGRTHHPAGHNSGRSTAPTRASTDAPSPSGRGSKPDVLTTSPLGPDHQLIMEIVLFGGHRGDLGLPATRSRRKCEAQPDQPVADPGLHRAERDIEPLCHLALAVAAEVSQRDCLALDRSQ